jgi:hypothetical protein
MFLEMFRGLTFTTLSVHVVNLLNTCLSALDIAKRYWYRSIADYILQSVRTQTVIGNTYTYTYIYNYTYSYIYLGIGIRIHIGIHIHLYVYLFVYVYILYVYVFVFSSDFCPMDHGSIECE